MILWCNSKCILIYIVGFSFLDIVWYDLYIYKLKYGENIVWSCSVFLYMYFSMVDTLWGLNDIPIIHKII
jgi:hypothetical protein